MARLLVRGARQLLTLREAREPRFGPRMGELGIVPDGSLLTLDSAIDEVGSTRRVVNLNKAQKAEVIDASGCVVLPGFVDPLVDLPVLKDAMIFFEHGTTALGCRTVPAKVRRQLATLDWMDSVFLPVEDSLIGILTPLLPMPGIEGGVSPRERIDSGGGLALATRFDGGAVRTHSMQASVALACIQMHLTAAEAITAATTNAAHAIGLGTILGSLDPGKQADLIILDLPDYEKIPYHFGENLVRAVIKLGKVVYQRGERTWADG